MFQTTLTILGVIIGASIPIILWGYLFSYFDSQIENKKRFLFGIGAGIVSVFPVLFLKNYGEELNNYGVNVFYDIANLSNFWSYLGVFFSFVLLLVVISGLPFFLSLRQKVAESLKLYGKNLLIFIGFLFGIVAGIAVLEGVFDIFSGLNFEVEKNLSVGDVVFNSLKLVLFYYLIVGIVEELSKFFSFRYGANFSIHSIKEGVIFAMFVALGFAFFENILYFWEIYKVQGFGQGLVGVYVSRNIFSVVLHVLCSSVFAYFFTKAYLAFQETFHTSFLLELGKGFLFALILHVAFNVFLTLDITFMIFVYLVGAYFYLTYIFYEEE